ncbi:MAG: Rpn family recombination-promoting nuclease/putative transposase [bacterium]|nr:Rpn family recombination-promoting nuclease/putative transposase [bacterium]
MLASLDNETIFKTAFTDKAVFTGFVKDILGIDINVSKIETEKKFEGRPGNIDIIYDIFAESNDHRVIVEIQRVDYDYNFDRFLHYHNMAVAQLQQKARDYKIEQTVYTVVVLTAPYIINEKTGAPIKDDVLISSVDPRNLQDKVVPIYGHKLIFLNHRFRKNNTPENYKDWLDLFYESINNPENFKVNLSNKSIKKAVSLIEYEKLSSATITQMKINAQKKAVKKIIHEMGKKEGKVEGKVEGKEEGKKEMARNLKNNGIDIEVIAKSSGLSIKEIEAL